MTFYNYNYIINGRPSIISLKEELTDHLKRHLDNMINNNRDIIQVIIWLENRGYQVILK